MLHDFDDLGGYSIRATDGELGAVSDLYFDDSDWSVRYLVADTRRWLPGRRVLLVPDVIEEAIPADKAVAVSLSVEQVKESPEIGEDLPVSAEHERALHDFYGWSPYWVVYPGYAGPLAFGSVVTGGERPGVIEAEGPRLRSAAEVAGYRIAANDGEIGHVETFLVDDEAWAIRYLVVDTRNWLPGRKVLVSPSWITGVSWSQNQVKVDLAREQVKDGPPYHRGQPLNREQESVLFVHYGRPTYWDEQPRPKTIW
jgi:hypothetical protein